METFATRIEPYLDQLRKLPFVRNISVYEGSRRVAGSIALETPSGRTHMECEFQNAPLRQQPAQRLVDDALGQPRPSLLVLAPAVGTEVGDLLERGGVNFIDLGGNCFIRIGEQYVARIQGRKGPRVSPSDKGLHASSYRVLFAFLAEPDLVDSTTRRIATESGGVSPQTVSNLRARLVADRQVIASRRRYRWVPGGRRHALDMWLAGYAATLFPKLLIGRFRAKETSQDAAEQHLATNLGDPAQWRWGGGAAAYRLTGYFRGDKTLVYVSEKRSDLGKRLGLVRDPIGPICIASSPGPLAFVGPDPTAVHPLVAYADLLGEGDARAREAAQELHRRYLRGLLEKE